jgi:hypothetical protein
MPSGYSIDTSKTAATSYNVLGNCYAYDANTGVSYVGNVININSSSFCLYNHASNGAYIPTVPITWTTNDELRLIVKVPILGWSSSTIMSSEADTRVCACRVNTSSTSIAGDGSWVTAIFSGTSYDTHGGYNSTTGEYTAKVAGTYKVKFQSRYGAHSSTGYGIGMYKNGVIYSNSAYVGTTSGTVPTPTYSDAILLSVGDVLTFRLSQSTGSAITLNGTASNYATIERLSGPTQIAAESTVYAEYTSNAGQVITALTNSIIDFEDKVIDTHGCVTTGTSWKFTAPKTGYYACNLHFLINSSGAFSGTEKITAAVFKNGSVNKTFTYDYPATGDSYTGRNCSFEIYLLQGQYFDIRVSQDSGGSLSLNTNTDQNWITVYSK